MSIGTWDEAKLYITKTIEDMKSDLLFVRKEQLDTREKLTIVSAQLQGLEGIKTDLKLVQEKVTVIQTKLIIGVTVIGIVVSALMQWIGSQF